MILSFKTEIYPTSDQEVLINQCFGVRRFVFNSMLMNLKHKYKDLKEHKNEISLKEVSLYRKVLRTKYKFIVETAPSQIVETVLEDFSSALNSLWKKGKDINLRKKKESNSFRISRKNESNFKYQEGSKYLSIVRLGLVKMAEPLRFKFSDNIKLVTISKRSNRYFISVTMDVNNNEIKICQKTNKKIGFDWGIKTFLTGYDGNNIGEIIFDQKQIQKLNINIARKAKALSTHHYHSKNFFKAKTKLEKVYNDKVNFQEDFLKKTALEITRLYDEVVLEDLSLSFLLKNHNLARKAAEGLFYKFKVILANKMSQSDKKVLVVDKTFASTQICSCCGFRFHGVEKLKLSNRTFNCPSCKSSLDRDENAAINIYNFKNPKLFKVG